VEVVVNNLNIFSGISTALSSAVLFLGKLVLGTMINLKELAGLIFLSSACLIQRIFRARGSRKRRRNNITWHVKSIGIKNAGVSCRSHLVAPHEISIEIEYMS
jgi:hypothetical protein